jgi:hypothetical protein
MEFGITSAAPACIVIFLERQAQNMGKSSSIEWCFLDLISGQFVSIRRISEQNAVFCSRCGVTEAQDVQEMQGMW